MSDILNQLDVIIENFSKLKSKSELIERISTECVNAIKSGNKVMFCGNGGSASDSQHLAAELICRYKKERPAINALALTTDISTLTAMGNDCGYDKIFERQVEAIGKSGDVLIGISTSGNSESILSAVQKAKSMGIKTIGFTGQNGGKLKNIADITLDVPSDITNNIQEMHIAAGHIICEIIEENLFI